MKFKVHAVALVGFVVGAVSALALSQLAGESRQTAPPQPTTGPEASSTDWLTGSPDEKFAQIERHLRGLDMSMTEIGYRYDELMQAGEPTFSCSSIARIV